MAEAQAEAPVKGKKETAPKIPVTMKDGRVVEFTERQKCVTEDIDGGLRFNFKSTDVLTVMYAETDILKDKFYTHGIRQKYQDEFASAKDSEDAFEWVSDLHTRIKNGDWGAQREGGGVSGAGLLVRALMEMGNKSREEIKGFLADKSRKEQEIMRDYPPIRAKIDEIKARSPKTDTSEQAKSLLGGLGIAAQAA